MTLVEAQERCEYMVNRIDIDDDELRSFLFTLGCYVGERITVVSHLKGSCVVAVKNGRYSMDNQLSKLITVS